MKCKWCSRKATIKQGHIWLCDRHYRFQQMRVNAKRNGKTVPTYEHLEEMKFSRCPVCDRKMNWRGKDGQSTVVSLQHDDNGEMRLLCRACNTRHSGATRDRIYHLENDEKICPRCGEAKNISKFSADRSGRYKGKKTYCIECANKYVYEWINKNKEKFNAKRRKYYHERKANGNPIPRQSP